MPDRRLDRYLHHVHLALLLFAAWFLVDSLSRRDWMQVAFYVLVAYSGLHSWLVTRRKNGG